MILHLTYYTSFISIVLDLSILLQVNGKTITTDVVGLSPNYKIKNVEDLVKTLILF